VSWDQVLSTNANAIMLIATLAGLVLRDRVRLCGTFAFYLVLAFTGNRLALLWPELFWNYDWWRAKENAYSIVSMLIVVEIAILTFAAAPRARNVTLALVAGVLFLTLVAIVDGPLQQEYWVRFGVMEPHGKAGSIWLFVVLLAAANYFRVPLHPLHRSIVLGFVLYRSVWAWLLAVLAQERMAAYPFVSALDGAAYLSTTSLWCAAGWRPQAATALTPAAHARLRPWE
jgi:hypothetical protein